MIRFVLLICLCLVVGTVGGVYRALVEGGITSPAPLPSDNTVAVGNWVSDWTIGSNGANDRTRAVVARRGLFALRKEEAVYFILAKDDKGAALSERCSYVLSGGPQQAVWWSVTLYNAQSMLPDNEDDALSLFSRELPGENWRIVITPNNQAGFQWLSSKGAGEGFDLMIRLYRPSKAVLENPGRNFNPPTLTRSSCEGGV